MKRAPIAVIFAVTMALSLPGFAYGAVSVGQDCGANNFSGGLTVVQEEASFGTPSYSMPGDGVLTAAYTSGPNVLGNSLKVKVFRRTANPAQFEIAGQSAGFAPIEPGLNHYSTRIPVKKDDLLGMSTTMFSLRCDTLNVSDVTRSFTGDPAKGEFVTGSQQGLVKLALTATLEPDTDADGFGDETQDKCAGSSGPTDGCPLPVAPPITDRTAPVQTLSFKRKQRLSKFSVTVAVDEPSSLVGTATVNLPGSFKLTRFKQVTRAAGANTQVKLRFRLSKKNRGRATRAIDTGKRLKAKLAIQATDAAGNATTTRASIGLIR